jgi:hypothetical protein
MPKRAGDVLNLSDKRKFLDLVKGGMSLAEVRRHYGKSEWSIRSIWDKGQGEL